MIDPKVGFRGKLNVFGRTRHRQGSELQLYHRRGHISWFPAFYAEIDHQVKGDSQTPKLQRYVFLLATSKCLVGGTLVPSQYSGSSSVFHLMVLTHIDDSCSKQRFH